MLTDFTIRLLFRNHAARIQCFALKNEFCEIWKEESKTNDCGHKVFEKVIKQKQVFIMYYAKRETFSLLT